MGNTHTKMEEATMKFFKNSGLAALMLAIFVSTFTLAEKAAAGERGLSRSQLCAIYENRNGPRSYAKYCPPGRHPRVQRRHRTHVYQPAPYYQARRSHRRSHAPRHHRNDDIAKLVFGGAVLVGIINALRR